MRRTATHFFADDGERIHVWVSGVGPPMVLLHEWASSHAIWESLVGGLGGHFTVYRWDARGHGGQVGRAVRRQHEMLESQAVELPGFQGFRGEVQFQL